jgi:hypothetical protein
MKRFRENVREHLGRGKTKPWAEVRDRLNRKLRGWAQYSKSWVCSGYAIGFVPRARESAMKPVGKPDAANPHVRFDERGWETGGAHASVPAPILDSTTALVRSCGTPQGAP